MGFQTRSKSGGDYEINRGSGTTAKGRREERCLDDVDDDEDDNSINFNNGQASMAQLDNEWLQNSSQ